jgi:hypothetical protein
VAIEIRHHFSKEETKKAYRRAWAKTAVDLVHKVGEISGDIIVHGPNFDGDLLGSWTWWKKDDLTWFCGYTAPYAKAVEFGSKPHWAPPDALYDWCRRKLGKNGPVDVPVDRLFALAFGKAHPRYEAERTFIGVYRKIGTVGTEPQPYLRPGTERAAKEKTKFYIKHLAKEGF